MSDLYKKIMGLKGMKAKLYTEEDFAEETKPECFLDCGTITGNLLMSGKVTGAFPLGKMSSIYGDSKMGKSFLLYQAMLYAQKVLKMTVVLLDAEFAWNYSWAKKLGLDVENLIVIQENKIEEVQKIYVNMTEDLTKEEKKKLFFGLDSLNALVTSHIMDIAREGGAQVDMSITKKKNNLTKLMNGSGVTTIVLNHCYTAVGAFVGGNVAAGGKGITYFCSSVMELVSKKKDRDGDEISGSIITARTDKSRFGKENSKLKFRIKNEGGLCRYYGLLDDALEGKYVIAPTQGYYSRPSVEGDKKWRESQIYNGDFWLPIFTNTDFRDYLESKYSYKDTSLDIATDKFSETVK